MEDFYALVDQAQDNCSFCGRSIWEPVIEGKQIEPDELIDWHGSLLCKGCFEEEEQAEGESNERKKIS